MYTDTQNPRGEEIGQRCYDILQAFYVGYKSTALYRKKKPVGRSPMPRFVAFGPLKGVERAVDFDRVNLMRGVFQLALLGAALRVKSAAAPRRVSPSGNSDSYLRHGCSLKNQTACLRRKGTSTALGFSSSLGLQNLPLATHFVFRAGKQVQSLFLLLTQLAVYRGDFRGRLGFGAWGFSPWRESPSCGSIESLPQRLGDRAAFFRLFGDLLEFGLFEAGNCCLNVEVYGGDRKASAGIFDGHGRCRCNLVGFEAGFPELAGKRHRKAACVSSANQLFGVRARFVAEPLRECLRHGGKDATFGRNDSFSILQTTIPNSRSFTLHTGRIVLR
jgi:hypothetical protein